MHIKQVIIKGFKSYHDKTIIGPFDKKHNVLVGRNGSGKSNFFCAIQFVLSNEFSHLRQEERQALLHESTGPRDVSAYVEIIFDNNDARLPIDQEEVSIRRMIDAKKDQYLLNNGNVTRKEVMNLLDSAAFSVSNPYYIVKQGKINEIATSPDAYRLKILREVAGTHVYDDLIKKETIPLLLRAELTLEKSKESLKMIEERTGMLEKEREDLKQYIILDKKRRALEYTIHTVESSKLKGKLTNLKEEREKMVEEQANCLKNLKTVEKDIELKVHTIKEFKKAIVNYEEEKETINNEHHKWFKAKIKHESTLKDLYDDLEKSIQFEEHAENELIQLTHLIVEKEAELKKIAPEYEAIKNREEGIVRELRLKKQKLKDMYAKQSRGSQFISKEERNVWIRNQLTSRNNLLAEQRERIDNLAKDVEGDSNKLIVFQQKIEEVENEMKNCRERIDDNMKHSDNLKKDLDLQNSSKTKLYQAEKNAQQNLMSSKEDLEVANRDLQSVVGKAIINGYNSLRKVLDTFENNEISEAYYGTVIENLSCGENTETAVEVTAGNKLFYHIVKNDQIATQLLKEINKQKLPGVINFIPLNRLKVHEINYPKQENVLPMISTVIYNAEYDKAMKHLFAKTLICRNMETAVKIAHLTGLNCVTSEGEQVSSRGVLSGGFYNIKRSRLKIYKKQHELTKQVKTWGEKMKDVKSKLENIVGHVSNTIAKMQEIEMENNKLKTTYDILEHKLQLLKEQLNNIQNSQVIKKRDLAQYKLELEEMQISKNELETELQQEFLPHLSAEDQTEVNLLNNVVKNLENESKTIISTRIRLEGEKNKLENLLYQNLIRQKSEIISNLQNNSSKDLKQKLNSFKTELEEIVNKIENVEKEIKNPKEKIEELSLKLKFEQECLEKREIKKKNIREQLNKTIELLEKFASKCSLLERKIIECTKNVDEMGPLPSQDLRAKYEQMPLNLLLKQLENVNKQLKTYSHVNKKAADQFNNLSEHKNRFLNEIEDLDKSVKSLRQFLTVMERHKSEAVQSTFNEVSKYFTQIFKKLVPSGHASLIMKTARDSQDQKYSDCFTGVRIKVSFVDSDAEMQELNQLSGGQKSLVALAFIFAIQKHDPAPFYIFDEIDQALDEHHREAVADLIHELSNRAQFITTTFRPELLAHAHQFYGVKFRNKISHIECVTKDEAKTFVEH